MAGRWYLTEYPVGRGKYGTELWARSARAAAAACRRRGIGEQVIGEGPIYRSGRASAALRSRASAGTKLHALCFLALLALSARVVTPAEVFGDEDGFLHRWAHRLAKIPHGDGSRPEKLAGIIRQVEAIERKIPGYLDLSGRTPRRRLRRPRYLKLPA